MRNIRESLILTISLGLFFTLGSVALAVGVSGTLIGVGAGDFIFDENWHLHWGGVLIVDLQGQQAGTFCTDLYHPIMQGDQVYATDQTIDCRIQWLMHHYPPALSGLSNTEAAARQGAVWYFADNFRPHPATLVGQRAWQIINEVNALTENGANPGLACDDLWGEPITLEISPASVAVTAGIPTELTVIARQGETPLSNLTVNLSSNLGSLNATTVTTGSDGRANFTITSATPGTAKITAQARTQLPIATVFQGVNIERQKLVLGQQAAGDIFAAAQATWQQVGDITAHIFHDRNMNGEQDSVVLETHLAGWSVTLRDATGHIVGNGLSDSNGNVHFNGLANGTYSLSYNLAPGWFDTTGQQATVTVNDDSQLVNFGVIQSPLVIAYQFHDVNGNGQPDSGEQFLAGWQMALYRSNGDFVLGANGVTDDQGRAPLTFLRQSEFFPGDYTVGVEMTGRDGWFATTPTRQTITLNGGEMVEVYFGSRTTTPLGSITVVEESNPAATFGFTGNLGAFNLAAGESRTFTDLAPGRFTLAQDPASFASPYFILLDVQCVDQATSMPLSLNRTDLSASFDLAAGQQISCIFRNEAANFGGGDQHQIFVPLVAR